ncbi:putative RNA-binding protein 46 [Diretmus argenteus]
MNEDMGDFMSDRAQEALLALMEETGYNLVQENGERRFGGPPPGWVGDPPPRGCEVFVGKIPRDVFEDVLIPVFKRAGRIYEFRLMMEFSGENRGFAFVKYTVREAAQRAIQMLDNFQIRPGSFITVCESQENCRLFIGRIPEDKRRVEIMEELKKVTDEVVDVIVYPSNIDKSKNRGFAFIEYGSHKAALMARRKLRSGTYLLVAFGSMISRVYERWFETKRTHRRAAAVVRNLMMGTTEEMIHREFSCFKPGSVKRVKKLTHYAFVYYHCREDAITALQLMNGAVIDGVPMKVELAKPSGSKDGSLAGRRDGTRAYPGNNTGGGAGVMVGRYDDRSFLLQRNDREMFGREDAVEGSSPPRPLPPPSRPGRPFNEGTQVPLLSPHPFPRFCAPPGIPPLPPPLPSHAVPASQAETLQEQPFAFLLMLPHQVEALPPLRAIDLRVGIPAEVFRDDQTEELDALNSLHRGVVDEQWEVVRWCSSEV